MQNLPIAELDFYYLHEAEPNRRIFEGLVIFDRDIAASHPDLLQRIGLGLSRLMQAIQRNLIVVPPQQRKSISQF